MIKLKIYGIETTTDGSGKVNVDVEAFFTDDQGAEHALPGCHQTVMGDAAAVAQIVAQYDLTTDEGRNAANWALNDYVVSIAMTQDGGIFNADNLTAAVQAYLAAQAANALAEAVAQAVVTAIPGLPTEVVLP